MWRDSGHRLRPARRKSSWLVAESLERRQIPALLYFPAGVTLITESVPNETVDVAQPLGDLSVNPAVGTRGTIGDGPAAAADVAWYHFTLGAPAEVTLSAGPTPRATRSRGSSASTTRTSTISMTRSTPWAGVCWSRIRRPRPGISPTST